MSVDADLAERFRKYTQELKNLLYETFEGKIAFYKVNKRLIVHSSNVNPCQYALATMTGADLRDDDLTKAFTRLVRGKLKGKDPPSWPPTPEEFIATLDTVGPLSHIYNAIAWSVNPLLQKNEFGYITTRSSTLSEKILAVTSHWESLDTHKLSPKSRALSLVVYRITGSKEVA